MLKSNGVWWFALLGIFLFGIVGLGIGQKEGFDKGYDSGYEDGINANPIATVNTNPYLNGYSYMTYNTDDTSRQSELSQQIMDFLGEASKVDISIKGDKVNGGIIDIHLEFDK